MVGAAAGQANEPLTMAIALNLSNLHRFSPHDKTYSVEGGLQLSAPAELMKRLQRAGVDPIELLRFQNQVEPWNSVIKPASRSIRLGSKISRNYFFSGTFYSDDIDDQ